MKNLYNQFQKESQWFKDNIVKAKPEDIKISTHLHCGVPMEEYVGSDFVDWTHKCTKCKIMYGCA